MALTLPDLIQTFTLSLRDPRQAARRVIAWPLSVNERWTVLALTAVTSTLSIELFVALAPEAADPAMASILVNPLAFAAMQFCGIVLMAGLIFVVGGRFGGTGSFADVLAVMGWMQVVLLALQLAQVVALILLPPLVGVIALISLGLTLWLMPSFIAELHGFRSAFLTFLAMVGTLFALVVVLSLALVFLFGLGA